MGRTRHPAALAAAILVLLTGVGGSCSPERHVEPTPDPAALEDPELRLLVITDLDGYLEPCGCTSRPLGGIDRMSARLQALRDEGVPSLLVMAGNVFFHGAPHGADAARATDQEVMRAQTMRDIINDFEVAAVTPGPLDFAFGVDRFVSLVAETDSPMLAAGVQIEGTEEPVFAPSVTVEVSGIRVALVGLTQLEGEHGARPDRITVDSVLEAGASAIAEADADVVIALVEGDRRFARRVARIDGLDFVVHGGLDEAEAHSPASSDGAAILHAGRQGQGLLVADLRRGQDTWTDVSEWTREEERTHLQGRIESLERRIAAWEADDTTEAADLAAQRRRLASLRGEREALDTPPTVEGGYFRARYEELPPEAPRDSAVSERMGALDRRVNDHNEELFAEWTAEPAAEGAAHYVGSERCGTCHASAAAWWRSHPHGRAYATLVDRHKNFNLSCVGCHVTGYLRPGGSTVTHVDNLQNVGCESCHGPGSMHIAHPSDAAVNVRRSPDESTCLGCHTPEHSDTFQFTAYRQTLLVPGHGRPAN